MHAAAVGYEAGDYDRYFESLCFRPVAHVISAVEGAMLLQKSRRDPRLKFRYSTASKREAGWVLKSLSMLKTKDCQCAYKCPVHLSKADMC